MAIDLITVTPRHERRIRLTFTNNLGAGAFGTPPTAGLYTIQNTDGKAVTPVVVSALIVSGNPETVELALSQDLVPTAQYRVNAVGVPATDATVTPVGSHGQFRFGVAPVKHTVEPTLRDRERLLFRTDIIWNGADYEETPSGDLSRVSGRANVTKGLWRSVETRGLPWDPSWGVDIREYVDSPTPTSASLVGALTAQILKDPRVSSVSTEVEIQGENTIIHIKPVLVGNEPIDPVSVTVPNQ